MVMDGIYTSHASEELKYEAYNVGAMAGFMCLWKTHARPKLAWAGWRRTWLVPTICFGVVLNLTVGPCRKCMISRQTGWSPVQCLKGYLHASMEGKILHDFQAD
jgi:hypothetical protein